MPKVSIIIATHSRPQLLPRAVKSAFEGGEEVEVIVVDDASTDETAKVCQTLEGIKYVRVERNQRTAGARNLGILASSAPYLGFLDDDDWRLPGSLDKQIELLEKNPKSGLVYGQFLTANQTGMITQDAPAPEICPQGDIFWKILEENAFGCLTAVFRKDCIYKVGMLDPIYTKIDDWDLWVRIAEIYPIVALQEPVAVWRRAEVGSNQGSSNAVEMFMLGADAYKNKWFNLPRVVSELGDKSIERQEILLDSVAERIIQDMCYRSANKREMFQKLIQAIKCNPNKAAKLNFYKMIVKNFILN